MTKKTTSTRGLTITAKIGELTVRLFPNDKLGLLNEQSTLRDIGELRARLEEEWGPLELTSQVKQVEEEHAH